MREPYRVFFPLGILCGVAGVAIWPLYAFGIVATYSGRSHALVQTFGFLYAFVAGFLLTAVPRFTGTGLPSIATQAVLAFVIGIAAAASGLRAFAVGASAFLIAHAMLIGLVGRRFLRRTAPPPPTFVLVGLALAAGVAGAVIETGVALERMPAGWDVLGRRLLTEGMVLLLVLGVGGILGPRLLGVAAPGPPRGVMHDPRTALASGAVILATLVAEYGFDLAWPAYLRAAVVSAMVVVPLRLWQRPKARTTVSWTIWLAHWLIAAGVWLEAVAPRYRADFLHVLLAGAFTLLILAIGTRVALSHGGYDLGRERRLRPLRVAMPLVLVATLARIGAPFAGATYFAHLAWAGTLWIAGILWWGTFLVRSILGAAPKLMHDEGTAIR